MRTALRLLLIGSSIILNACAAAPPLQGPPTDLQAVFQRATQQRLVAPPLQHKAPPVGPEAPYTPIMQPPVVQRIWIPDHLNDQDDLVSGHWVYLLLEPSKWFLESYPASPTPTLRAPLAAPKPLQDPAAFANRSTSGKRKAGKPLLPSTERKEER